MATNPDRASYFPAIEKKYDQPMSYWFDQMENVKGQKYSEQIAYLRENYGFTQTHANALVLYCRGSKSAKRYNTLDEYLVDFDATKQKTVREIFSTVTKKYRKAEIVIAWNKPMIKIGDEYIFGLSVHSKHILIAPWGDGVIEKFKKQLVDYETNKKTIKVPVDWKIDKKLILEFVQYRLLQLQKTH